MQILLEVRDEVRRREGHRVTECFGALLDGGYRVEHRPQMGEHQAAGAGSATTIVSNTSYLPFGPLNVLTFGNGRTLTKSYDQDYAIATESLRNQVLRIRNHPCIITYWYGSDNPPNERAERNYLEVFKELNWPNSVQASATAKKPKKKKP